MRGLVWPGTRIDDPLAEVTPTFEIYASVWKSHCPCVFHCHVDPVLMIVTPPQYLELTEHAPAVEITELGPVTTLAQLFQNWLAV
jgi:hypothetical protein